MKHIESENSSISTTELLKQGKTSHLSETLPQDRMLKAAPLDFWQAIRTVIALQNQAPPLQLVSRQGNLPLSFPQQRLWFLDQLAPGSCAYNIPMAFRIKGPLNVPVLEQSLNEIVQRHEALRTTFAIVDGQPVQVIAPALSVKISVVDLRELPNTEGETQALQLATESAQQSFDLNLGPLLRAALFSLSEHDHVLLLNVHHIAFDGWSAGILFQELSVFYDAFLTGKPLQLPQLPIQYADFAVWQRQWLQGEFLSTLLSYWKQQLCGLSAQHLITDRPRKAARTYRSGCQTLVLPKTLTEALRELSRKSSVTLFTTLLAAFKVLLRCYTNSDDLFVCTPIANRNRTEVKGLIGYFVNLLVLRTDLSGNPSFRELLAQIRQVSSAAYAHQDLPVQRLVDCLNLVHTPLSQVMFVLQNVPMQPLQLPSLTVTSLEIDNGVTDFDLFLSMQEEAENLTGMLKYNTDLFDGATIIRMLQQFQLLLESIVGNPAQPLSSLHLLTETEKIHQHAFPENAQARIEPERVHSTLTKGVRSTEYVAPRGTLEFQLRKIWQDVLGIEPIGVRDNFFELGGQSLLALRLFAQIEQISGKNLPLATLLQAPTIEQQASILEQEEWSASWPILVPIQTGGEKPPFFAVHGAYGNVIFYYDLVRHLDPRQPVYGIQPQGLDGKQLAHSRIEDMAAHYIRELRTLQPQGPYFLGGYSMGGKIALEMAQQLQVQGEKVKLVVLFDTLGASFLKPLPFRVRAFRHLNNLLRLKLKEKLTYVKQRLISKSNVDNTLPLFQGNNESPLHEAHLKANRDYVPQVYSGRAILFRSEPLEGWLEWWSVDPQLGWGGLFTEGLEVHEVPGNHVNMFSEPYVRVLAEKLQASLDQAQAGD
jgi:thioesterase domain-containing protein